MGNLRPLLSVNLVPAISEPVSNAPYDIIKVAKSKILPGRSRTGFGLVGTFLTYLVSWFLGFLVEAKYSMQPARVSLFPEPPHRYASPYPGLMFPVAKGPEYSTTQLSHTHNLRKVGRVIASTPPGIIGIMVSHTEGCFEERVV